MFYSEKDDREKQLRFSIRKVSFGAASVAVAALYLFMGSGAVSAAEAQTIQSNEEVAADKDSETEKKSEDPQLTYAAPAAKEQGSATNTEAGDEDSVSGDSSSPKSEGEGTRSEEASSKPKVRKRREADPAPPATAADDDLDANQVYTAPVDDASVEDLATKLKALPETVENEKKLANIDQVGATKSINPGEVSELYEFGGWKAVNGGKFGVARKTDNGVFPIETVNTVRTQNGKDKTWLNESSFERSKNYALFLGLVRTKATEQEEVDDRSKYTQEGDYSNKGKGVTKYKGIEKTFKNYSPETGSDVTVSFYTGITGDIDGNKAGYKVEVIAKTAEGNETIIYNQSFYPQNEISDENKIVKKLNLGRDAVLETNRSQTEDKKNELTEKLGEDSNKRRLGTSHGTFTSKNISLASGVTEYTVRISAADNKKLGMGFQVPWRQYALPVVGTGFRVTQDTRKVAKDLAKKVYDELARQKEKDTKWSTSETKADYEKKLNKIKENLDITSTTANYKTVVEEALEKRKQLDEEQQIKNKAKKAIEDKLKEKETAIEKNSKLSPREKAAAKEEAKAEADKATTGIMDAQSQDDVTTKQTDGTAAIDNVNPIGIDMAVEAIAAAAAVKMAEIEDNDKLSEDEKTAAKEKVVAAVREAGEAIKQAKETNNQDGVDQAQVTAISKVTAINPVGKEKAKQAIQDELDAKLQAINDNDKLSQDEKDKAKAAATAKAKAQTDIIDQQPGNADTPEEATKAQGIVDTAQATGQADVKKVNPVGKEKAKQAIQDELDAKLQAINDNDKLSQDEKDKAKADATAKAKAQTDVIDQQPGNADTPEEATKAQGIVDTAQATGQADVKKVNPVGKEKAKQAIQDELDAKLQAINDNDKLSQDEKDKAKADATAKAKAQTDIIDQQPGNADTPEEATKAQGIVDTAQATGQADVKKVNPVGKEKAKQAIQDELDAKLQAINDNDKLSQDEKDKAKADATAKAKAQTDVIDQQPGNADTPEEATKAQGIVDTAQATGQADVKKVNPVGKEKAKQAIQDELDAKLQAINDNDKLSQDEKDKAKADATAKAKAQTDIIDQQPGKRKG
ncbi:DUF1542 domain-containing protein [Streptococcus bouchesdurhonensis]|uniref:DUF1542 domain-containing protein n=1 Tax=Streptococcus bouchesdurhonensis TaxID=2954240 RepID=UPI0021C45056|nr:DUF1542 domain-containing protein [Streptococcus bouchesdurhonensis]